MLAATIGIPMGLSYPFDAELKVKMITVLVVSLVAMIFGLFKRDKLYGQISAVIGFVCWSYIGLLGLGTGT